MAAPSALTPQSDSTVLSAAYLNLVAEWIDYLFGLASNQNPAFQVYSDTNVGTGNKTVSFEHTYNGSQWFHWKCSFAGKNHDNFLITYNGTTIGSDGGDNPPVFSPSGNTDLSTMGLTIGGRYTVVITYAFQESGGTFTVDYLYSDTLPTV